MYAHPKRPDIKPRNPEKVAKACEMVVGQNMSIAETARALNESIQRVSFWLSKYWFYKKVNKPIIIKKESKINGKENYTGGKLSDDR